MSQFWCYVLNSQYGREFLSRKVDISVTLKEVIGEFLETILEINAHLLEYWHPECKGPFLLVRFVGLAVVLASSEGLCTLTKVLRILI
jgi:hypothetical protein